jgi:hypothetical protein
MDPDRRRRGRAGQPRSGWGAGARPPAVLFRVLLVLLAATLGVLIGITANRAIHARQATDAPASAHTPALTHLAAEAHAQLGLLALAEPDGPGRRPVLEAAAGVCTAGRARRGHVAHSGPCTRGSSSTT